MGKNFKEFPDLTGEKFGKFTVISLVKVDPNNGRIWLVRCDCGQESYKSTCKINTLKKNKTPTACNKCRVRGRDITGEKFGKFTVISLKGVDAKKGRIWLVRCDCGREFHKFAGQITSLKKRTAFPMCRKCRVKQRDLTGTKIGKFTVISFDRMDEIRGQMWLIRCDCGNEIYKSTGDITDLSKHTDPACIECAKIRRKTWACKDITGQKFDKLIAIKPIGGSKYGQMWLVRCDCGIETHRVVSQLNAGRKAERGQMCIECRNAKFAESRDRGSSTSYRLDRIRLRKMAGPLILEMDPLIDQNLGSHEAFRNELMYDLEQEICPRRGWLDEREIPGLSADFDDTITASNFPEYVDVNIERPEVQIENELDEDDDEMIYRVRPDGTIETDNVEEALRLSRILSNAPERTRATEQEIIDTVQRFFANQQFTSKQLSDKLGFDSGTAVREGLRLLHIKKWIKKHRSSDGTCFVWELVK